MSGDRVNKRWTVRVRIASDRRIETERELCGHARKIGAGEPFRQGTVSDLLWDFSDLERAQMFRVGIENTAGVVGVEGP